MGDVKGAGNVKKGGSTQPHKSGDSLKTGSGRAEPVKGKNTPTIKKAGKTQK